MQLGDQLEIFRLDEKQKKALKKLRLFTVADLLFYFPTRYGDISAIKQIANLVPGEIATVYGQASKLKTKKGFRSKIPMAEAELTDITGKIKIIWFHQAYLTKMIRPGENVKLTGKIALGKSGLYLANPELEKTIDLPIDSHDSLFQKNGSKITGLSYPIYHETRGITSKWLYHAIEKIFRGKILDTIEEYIPEDILKKYNLPSLKTALVWIHKPKNMRDAEAARKRFAFEEVFCIQLERQHDKIEYRKNKSFLIQTELPKILDPRGSRRVLAEGRRGEKFQEAQFGTDLKKFLSRFPFKLTASQVKSIETILRDMAKTYPMSRLLEGDVGSGKTAVAATASYVVVKSCLQNFDKLQVAYMAPTEILATQHFESFIEYFNPSVDGLPINIGLITGSGCRKFPSKSSQKFDGAMHCEALAKQWTDISRTQLLKWVQSGEISILIGTHALIQKTVKFKNLALVVIDEQHRFGTAQRRKLVRKDGVAPHLLSMTATPIPRTLALTIYGDLDLSLLDEMPAGRKQIITEIITPDKREETYEKVRKELQNGRQMYVICPRIAEPGEEDQVSQIFYPRGSHSEGEGHRGKKFMIPDLSKIETKSVNAEAKRLKKEIFPEYQIGILHSKMSKIKKEEVMKKFSTGKINILVATSVVEVGVNVPNATMIIIEGAERFGLAQLHQLRGRVLRSTYQAYCYIFANAKSDKTIQRLKALKTAKNGFELSELDLTLRGAGELGGTKQWGITDLGMEAIKNLKMVEAARVEAVRLISEDPELKKYPLLKAKIKQKVKEYHFE